MSISASPVERPSAGAEPDVLIAGPPPGRAAAMATPAVGRSTILWWWNPQSAQGWAGSLTLHTILLLSLAFWYFSPRVIEPIAMESRLAGSPDGLLDGDQLQGGSDGTPMLLARELAELESSTSLVQPEVTAPSQMEPARLSLARPSLTPMEAGPIQLEREPRRNRAGRAGNGVPGNWGAGNGEGFGLARFGNGGETIRGVAVKVGDPQFTLIWDTKGVDIDLHVLEPHGDRIYFGHRNGKQGGELDVDNTWGYGPENIYWLVPSGGRRSAKVKGPGPPGPYQWSVHYYAAHRQDRPPTHWQVRIKHAGEVKIVDGWLYLPGEWSQVYTLKVHPPREGGP